MSAAVKVSILLLIIGVGFSTCAPCAGRQGAKNCQYRGSLRDTDEGLCRVGSLPVGSRLCKFHQRQLQLQDNFCSSPFENHAEKNQYRVSSVYLMKLEGKALPIDGETGGSRTVQYEQSSSSAITQTTSTHQSSCKTSGMSSSLCPSNW